MSHLEDNLIVMDASAPCATNAQAASRLACAGYRIGLVGCDDNDDLGFAFLPVDRTQPLPDGVVACLSANAAWLQDQCRHVPNLVLLGSQSRDTGLAKAYPSALSWADDYLAPRVPRINRSQP